MKKLIALAVLSCFFAITNFAYSAEEVAPNVTTEFTQGDFEPGRLNLSDQVTRVIEIGDYFNTQYPGNAINEDFTDDVRDFFPKMSNKEVFDRARTIRDVVKLYRWGKNLYEEIKEKVLIPSAPPLIVADEDYDTVYTGDYIDAGENLVLITDIKKVLTYGSNPRDFEAYQAKIDRDLKKKKLSEMTGIEKMKSIFSNIEIKKLPFYSIYYDNPITQNKGIGDWDKNDYTEVRIVTDIAAINDSPEIRGALQVILPSDEAIPAFASNGFPKISVDFSKSKNLKDYKLLTPSPDVYYENVLGSIPSYVGNVAFPLLLNPEDVSQNMTIVAKVIIPICDFNGCKLKEFNPKLTLEAGESFDSATYFYVGQSFIRLPQESNSSINIKSIVVEEPVKGEDKETLRISVDVDMTIDRFDIFAESMDGIELGRARISINNNNVVARFQPIRDNVELADKDYKIFITVNRINSVASVLTAHKSNLFDTMRDRLSLNLILFGIVGGFLLNLMPCVFPVLSIKLLAMSNLGARKSLKKDFWLTTLGIFTAFLFLAVILSALKVAGVAIGWGMQFQNPLFIVTISFIIMLFIAHIFGTIKISVPIKTTVDEGNNFLNFLSGALVVLMATPCTAPYLGTAIGFALAGSVVDICVIMFSVALGLSLPYIIIAIIPKFYLYLPKPGEWMNKLNKIMILMLFLTVIWLMSILVAQTTLGTAVRLSVYLIVFLIFVWLRRVFVDVADEDESDVKVKGRVKRIFNITAWFILFIIYALAMFDVSTKFKLYQEQRLEDKEDTIDEEYIKRKVRGGSTVLVRVGADWCLTCSYNNILVFSNPNVADAIEARGIEVIDIDWTNYNEQVLNFMEKFGRKGLPFYVIFSPNVPDGMVLPEVLDERNIYNILNTVQY